MKQFIASLAIILSVAAVLTLNGFAENVQEVNSIISSEDEPSAEQQSQEEPILAPADLKEVFSQQDEPAAGEADVLPAELEYVFDAKFTEDGYTVEIYREFEIYRDADGIVIKEVPTSNFEYMRYKE